MTNPDVTVKTASPTIDDLFLCRAFAKAISSDRFHSVIEQQTMLEELPELKLNIAASSNDVEMDASSLASVEHIQWKIGDQCLCPYSEDELLYKATITDLCASTKTCTVSFDDYGNVETHPLSDLQTRVEEQHRPEPPTIDEGDILPVHPPLPETGLCPGDDNLSSTLMSWYLAGYHTGFYQGIRDKKSLAK